MALHSSLLYLLLQKNKKYIRPISIYTYRSEHTIYIRVYIIHSKKSDWRAEKVGEDRNYRECVSRLSVSQSVLVVPFFIMASSGRLSSLSRVLFPSVTDGGSSTSSSSSLSLGSKEEIASNVSTLERIGFTNNTDTRTRHESPGINTYTMESGNGSTRRRGRRGRRIKSDASDVSRNNSGGSPVAIISPPLCLRESEMNSGDEEVTATCALASLSIRDTSNRRNLDMKDDKVKRGGTRFDKGRLLTRLQRQSLQDGGMLGLLSDPLSLKANSKALDFQGSAKVGNGVSQDAAGNVLANVTNTAKGMEKKSEHSKSTIGGRVMKEDSSQYAIAKRTRNSVRNNNKGRSSEITYKSVRKTYISPKNSSKVNERIDLISPPISCRRPTKRISNKNTPYKTNQGMRVDKGVIQKNKSHSSFIGRLIAKDFEGIVYFGQVDDVFFEQNSGVLHFSVKYDDNDHEDMDETELMCCIELYVEFSMFELSSQNSPNSLNRFRYRKIHSEEICCKIYDPSSRKSTTSDQLLRSRAEDITITQSTDEKENSLKTYKLVEQDGILSQSDVKTKCLNASIDSSSSSGDEIKSQSQHSLCGSDLICYLSYSSSGTAEDEGSRGKDAFVVDLKEQNPSSIKSNIIVDSSDTCAEKERKNKEICFQNSPTSDHTKDDFFTEEAEKEDVCVSKYRKKLFNKVDLLQHVKWKNSSKSKSIRQFIKSNDIDWTEDDIRYLRSAYASVNPQSNSFWECVSLCVHGKSADECQDMWFSLMEKRSDPSKSDRSHKLKTSVNLTKKSTKGSHKCDETSGEHDDIFKSTPMRLGFQVDQRCEEKSLLEKDAGFPFDVDVIISSPNDLNASCPRNRCSDILPAADFPTSISRNGYKGYIQKFAQGRRKLARQKPQKKVDKQLTRNYDNHILAKMEEGDIALNANLTPGGTIKVKHLSESWSEDEFIDEENSFDSELY